MATDNIPWSGQECDRVLPVQATLLTIEQLVVASQIRLAGGRDYTLIQKNRSMQLHPHYVYTESIHNENSIWYANKNCTEV